MWSTGRDLCMHGDHRKEKIKIPFLDAHLRFLCIYSKVHEPHILLGADFDKPYKGLHDVCVMWTRLDLAVLTNSQGYEVSDYSRRVIQ